MSRTIDNEKFALLAQRDLAARGHYRGEIDGWAGPKTREAYAAALPPLPGAAAVTPPGSPVAARIVELAGGQLGIRETSKNQGPGIGKYWTATTYPDGEKNREPWCAAFVCWLVREAAGSLKAPFSLPRSPVAYDAEKWAAANKGKGVEIIADKSRIRPGDILVFNFSHIGVAEYAAAGSSVATIEGNTDAAGSREGGGVWRKSRALSLVRTVIRITA